MTTKITKNSEIYVGGVDWLQPLSTAARDWDSSPTINDVGEEVIANRYVNMLPNTNEGALGVPVLHRGEVTDTLDEHRRDATADYVFLTLDEDFGYGGRCIYPQFDQPGSAGSLLARNTTFMQYEADEWVNCGVAKKFTINSGTATVETASVVAEDNKCFVILTAKSGSSLPNFRLTKGSRNYDAPVGEVGIAELDISTFTGSGAITITTDAALTSGQSIEGVLLVGKDCGVG